MTQMLYHYCSTETFLSIISNRSIRLSSLTLSNDSMEGRLVATVLKHLAEQDSLPHPSLKILSDAIGLADQRFDGLGFCLSEKGDLLSQWRGYAADASGVSIGFSSSYLESLSRLAGNQPIGLAKVIYSQKEQEDSLQPIYQKLRPWLDAMYALDSLPKGLVNSAPQAEVERLEGIEAEKQKDFLSTIPQLLGRLFLLKAEDFAQEFEWRLICLHMNGDLRSTTGYHARQDRIIPFRSVSLDDSGQPPILEVILGPKHRTPADSVKDRLAHYKFGDVRVISSRATYR